MKSMRSFLRLLLIVFCMLCISFTTCADAFIIPSGIGVIQSEAFSGTDPSVIIIPESTTEIGSKAFAACESLTDIYLPLNAVSIAGDAFDSSDNLTFHVYMGSANANWVLDHGYSVAYMAADELDAGGWNKVQSLVENEAVSTSSNELYYTHRLIVRLNPGYEIPDVNSFKQDAEENPVVVPLEQNYYVIQFSNPTSARNCAATLESWEGCSYAEADYFISESSTRTLKTTLMGTGTSTDYMGFNAYADYLEKNVEKLGGVTVAVIDTGVNKSQVSCGISSKSYDLVNGRNADDGFEDSHGTNVAKQICNAFGKLAADHLTIISYRVVRPSDARASYLLVGQAIRRAKNDGANFVNISQVFESAYMKEQDNMYLQECISYFGAGSVYAAAGNNAAMSAQSALPARYCRSVTGAQYGDDGVTLVKASGTATGANYAGYDTTTSFATAKVVAAAAMLSLDPDPAHTLDNACEFVTTDCGKGMPNLAKYAVVPVSKIVLNNGEPLESILEIGDRSSIDYEVVPDNATVSTVTVTSSNDDIIEILSNTGIRVRIQAKAKGTANLIFTPDDGNVEPVIVPITVIKPVTSVTINGNTEETLMKGETLPLTATVLPIDATNTSVSWISSNDSIATVSETGVVSQVGSGTVTITASSNYDPTICDSVILTLSDIPTETGVTVSAAKEVIGIGAVSETLQMNAVVLPDGAIQTVSWSVDRPEIATIDENGLLTAVSSGEVIVSATSVSGKTGYKGIIIEQLPTAVSINGPASVNEGDTINMTAIVLPANAKNKEVVWSSATPSVATVDPYSGMVTGITEGTVVILATSKADRTVVGYYAINVTDLPQSISITDPPVTVMDIGDTLSLSASVLPDNESNRTITWSSNDTAVADVSSNGTVTAKQSGNVQISAITVNGLTDSIMLTVRQPYTLVFDANGGECSASGWTCYSGYAINDELPDAIRTGYTFVGWYTAASGGSIVTASSMFTSSSSVTVYAHWTPNEYTYDIVYQSTNGTALGADSITKLYDTTNSVNPVAFTGYSTPSSQDVVWDTTEKTIIFEYSPASVSTSTTSGTFTTSPQITYSTETQYRNRKATSVEICVKWTLVIHGKGSTTMQNAIHFWGKCGSVSIPNTKIISWNEWKGPFASGVNKTKSATSSWVTVPLTTTNQTTLSLTMELWQCNSSGTKLTGNTYKTGLGLKVNIPAY